MFDHRGKSVPLYQPVSSRMEELGSNFGSVPVPEDNLLSVFTFTRPQHFTERTTSFLIAIVHLLPWNQIPKGFCWLQLACYHEQIKLTAGIEMALFYATWPTFSKLIQTRGKLSALGELLLCLLPSVAPGGCSHGKSWFCPQGP